MTFEVGNQDFTFLLGKLVGPRYLRALFNEKFMSLGYGSFGKLHLAFDLEMGAFVALKNFPFNSTEYDEGTAVCPSDILKEGIVACSLDHRSLVLGRHYYVEDIGSPANHIVFGLCGFGSHENGQGFGYRSGQLLDKNNLVPFHHLRHCLGIAGSICDAVLHLHEKRILHRDIKPANVIISSSSSRAILCDLGSCYLLDRCDILQGKDLVRFNYWKKLKGLRRSAGSFGWEEPYQTNLTPDEKTDVYGICITIKYLLMGSSDDCKSHNAMIPIKLLDILNQGTSKNREERPTVATLKNELIPTNFY